MEDWRACRLRGGEVISCLYDMVPLRLAAFADPGIPIGFVDWFKKALTWSDLLSVSRMRVADELLPALLEAIEFPHRMKIGYWQLGADFFEASRCGFRVITSPPTFPNGWYLGTA